MKNKNPVVDQSVNRVDVIVKIVGGHAAVQIGHHDQIGIQHAINGFGNQTQSASIRNYIFKNNAGYID